MQEQEVGDGTNFVIVFAGALLEAAEELLRMVSICMDVIGAAVYDSMSDVVILIFIIIGTNSCRGNRWV